MHSAIALDDRSDAGENMKAVSEHLAERLYEAAGVYRDTDDQTSDNLDNQILPS